MQMIWLLGAAAPAKKVHFNLNGSELRGFPIKARSGQSSILYANPLAPKAVAHFCLCPAVITGGQCAHGGCLSKWAILTPLFCPISIPVVHTAGLHADAQTRSGKHSISSHLISSLPWTRPLFQKVPVTYVNGARGDRQVNHALNDSNCARWQTCPSCWQ